jgi:ATP adenylyltransferase
MKNSHKTAITRKKPSLPMQWLADNGYLAYHDDLLDYGCGKGFDADYFEMDKYDPTFFPKVCLSKQYDIVTCNYVLNVVDESEQEDILENIKWHLRVGGKAFFSVRRDIKTEGVNKRGTFQRNVVLDDRFKLLKVTKGYALYEITKEF